LGLTVGVPSIDAQTWIIDLEALGASPIGQLLPVSGTDGRTGEHYDSFAYLADPLPESVQLSSDTWTIVARAEAALARLDQATRQVPTPELLRDPAIRREAQSPSVLEGTYAPLATVLEATLEPWLDDTHAPRGTWVPRPSETDRTLSCRMRGSRGGVQKWASGYPTALGGGPGRLPRCRRNGERTRGYW
jgi:hypothetical protein